MTLAELWGYVQTILSLTATVVGLPAIILFFLNRKNANKKLELEGDTVDVAIFNAQRAGFQDMIVNYRAENDRIRAIVKVQGDEITQLRADNQTLSTSIRTLSSNLDALRHLLKSYVTRVGVPMTDEENDILEQTLGL